MYLISGQSHLRLQPTVALVAAHAKLRLYAVQGMVSKDAFMPQISVGKGAERLLRAAVCCDMGAARGTNNIFKSWCRMFGGQLLLLVMNAWCLKLFVNMVGEFLANPLSL